MKQRKVPLRKCILSNEMKPKKDMIRIVKNKENQIFVDPTGKQAGRGAYVSDDLTVIEDARNKQKLEKFFGSDSETLEPIYNEIIRLIYRKQIPKK